MRPLHSIEVQANAPLPPAQLAWVRLGRDPIWHKVLRWSQWADPQMHRIRPNGPYMHLVCGYINRVRDLEIRRDRPAALACPICRQLTG